MSRIGKRPILIPEGVSIKIEDNVVAVRGPKGELRQKLEQAVIVKIVKLDSNEQIKVSVKNPKTRRERALWGLSQKLIDNMITGVREGFEKKLEIIGLGYKAALGAPSFEGRKTLTIWAGYSHPINFELPEGIDVKIEKNIITIEGLDKQMVGEVAAQIRRIRKPEPYKGKGIKYVDEIIKRKAGKAAKSATE